MWPNQTWNCSVAELAPSWKFDTAAGKQITDHTVLHSRDKEITVYTLQKSDSELISLLICVTGESRARMSYKRWKPWKTWETTPWTTKRSSIWNRGSGLQRARNKWKRLTFNNPALCVHSKIHCFPSLHKEQSAAVWSLQKQKKNSNSLQKEHLALIHWLGD